MLGEKHRETFVVPDPARVPVPAVCQVRREQRVQAIVRELALQGFEANLLQYHTSVGIAQNFLVNPIPSRDLRIRQFKGWNSRLEWAVLKCAMPFLFREEVAAIGHNESQVACAGLINAREVDLIEDPVTDGEPYFAVLIERGTCARLGARRPARRDARPSGRIAYRGVSHEVEVSVRQRLPADLTEDLQTGGVLLWQGSSK